MIISATNEESGFGDGLRCPLPAIHPTCRLPTHLLIIFLSADSGDCRLARGVCWFCPSAPHPLIVVSLDAFIECILACCGRWLLVCRLHPPIVASRAAWAGHWPGRPCGASGGANLSRNCASHSSALHLLVIGPLAILWAVRSSAASVDWVSISRFVNLSQHPTEVKFNEFKSYPHMEWWTTLEVYFTVIFGATGAAHTAPTTVGEGTRKCWQTEQDSKKQGEP
jgi:hypothetical protein